MIRHRLQSVVGTCPKQRRRTKKHYVLKAIIVAFQCIIGDVKALFGSMGAQ